MPIVCTCLWSINSLCCWNVLGKQGRYWRKGVICSYLNFCIYLKGGLLFHFHLHLIDLAPRLDQSVRGFSINAWDLICKALFLAQGPTEAEAVQVWRALVATQLTCGEVDEGKLWTSLVSASIPVACVQLICCFPQSPPAHLAVVISWAGKAAGTDRGACESKAHSPELCRPAVIFLIFTASAGW